MCECVKIKNNKHNIVLICPYLNCPSRLYNVFIIHNIPNINYIIV